MHSYPALLYVGLVLGVLAGNQAAHRAGLDAFRVFVATFVLIIPALAGARLLFVSSNWHVYRRDLKRIWNPTDSGASQYGGFLVALPLSIPLLASLQLPFAAFWDVASFTILVGMIFTRIGCLLNGCCSGRASTAWWALYLPNRHRVWDKRIPTQILEAGWAAVLLLIGTIIWKSLPFAGALFLFVIAGYASGRLMLESLRDHLRAGQSFTIQHAISLGIIAASLAALTIRAPR